MLNNRGDRLAELLSTGDRCAKRLVQLGLKQNAFCIRRHLGGLTAILLYNSLCADYTATSSEKTNIMKQAVCPTRPTRN